MLYKYGIVIMNTLTGIFHSESIVKRKRSSEFLVIVNKCCIFGETDGGWFFGALLFEKEERVKCIDYGLLLQPQEHGGATDDSPLPGEGGGAHGVWQDPEWGQGCH